MFNEQQILIIYQTNLTIILMSKSLQQNLIWKNTKIESIYGRQFERCTILLSSTLIIHSRNNQKEYINIIYSFIHWDFIFFFFAFLILLDRPNMFFFIFDLLEKFNRNDNK
jgi:hypothetical protein